MDLKILSKELSDELDNVQLITLDVVKQADLSIVLCRNLISKFKKAITKKGFENDKMEIEFFKEIKQIPLSNLIYYSELRSFEIQYPKGNTTFKKQAIVKKINKLNRFFVVNMDFVQYIEQEHMYLDDHYFTRIYFNNFNATHSKYYYRDPDFSTSHDLLLAKLTANKRLIKYLEERFKNVNRRNGAKIKNVVKGFKWTASKSALVELIYALNYNRAINNGEIELKEMVIRFQEIFDFDMKDFYKTYSEIKARKKSRTKFLDELSEGLMSRMNKEDD
ncbi:RteC domain-containing protein [Flavivirga jejuensis]|uniref:RteC domain-containing protein n=1 Tax=Flavivirga jejuensis TaxID=870487 RepID=A0ABT8WV50_9FLAO|nr:RteC domain-containing protein [Flavivirga jejuensis]MDO5976964.1 RteC domain-containing protein [Flavivirga jejuensis]